VHEDNHHLTSPHPPAPSPTAQAREKGTLPRLAHPSKLPPLRKCERGGGAGVRATPCAQLQARA